jgi:hypothetical protein
VEAEFKSDLGPSVLQLNSLIPFLLQERPVLYDERKLACIVGRIEMYRSRRSLEMDQDHIKGQQWGRTATTVDGPIPAAFSMVP